MSAGGNLDSAGSNAFQPALSRTQGWQVDVRHHFQQVEHPRALPFPAPSQPHSLRVRDDLCFHLFIHSALHRATRYPSSHINSILQPVLGSHSTCGDAHRSCGGEGPSVPPCCAAVLHPSLSLPPSPVGSWKCLCWPLIYPLPWKSH